MQIIRKSLEDENISGHSADIILASWRSGTQKQYQTYINKWLNYSCERELDSLHPSLAGVIQFLTALFEMNISYNSLNTPRSALSTNITAASVSAAHRAQAPVQAIIRKAGWSCPQTFAIFYDKNLDTSESSASQVQEAILTL